LQSEGYCNTNKQNIFRSEPVNGPLQTHLFVSTRASPRTATDPFPQRHVTYSIIELQPALCNSDTRDVRICSGKNESRILLVKRLLRWV